MKRNWKRILSLWLTVCMVFTMNFGFNAVSAFADTDIGGTEQPIHWEVADANAENVSYDSETATATITGDVTLTAGTNAGPLKVTNGGDGLVTITLAGSPTNEVTVTVVGGEKAMNVDVDSGANNITVDGDESTTEIEQDGEKYYIATKEIKGNTGASITLASEDVQNKKGTFTVANLSVNKAQIKVYSEGKADTPEGEDNNVTSGGDKQINFSEYVLGRTYTAKLILDGTVPYKVDTSTGIVYSYKTNGATGDAFEYTIDALVAGDNVPLPNTLWDIKTDNTNGAKGADATYTVDGSKFVLDMKEGKGTETWTAEVKTANAGLSINTAEGSNEAVTFTITGLTDEVAYITSGNNVTLAENSGTALALIEGNTYLVAAGNKVGTQNDITVTSTSDKSSVSFNFGTALKANATATLKQGGNAIKTSELNQGAEYVKFDGLEPGTEYTLELAVRPKSGDPFGNVVGEGNKIYTEVAVQGEAKGSTSMNALRAVASVSENGNVKLTYSETKYGLTYKITPDSKGEEAPIASGSIAKKTGKDDTVVTVDAIEKEATKQEFYVFYKVDDSGVESEWTSGEKITIDPYMTISANWKKDISNLDETFGNDSKIRSDLKSAANMILSENKAEFTDKNASVKIYATNDFAALSGADDEAKINTLITHSEYEVVDDTTFDASDNWTAVVVVDYDEDEAWAKYGYKITDRSVSANFTVKQKDLTLYLIPETRLIGLGKNVVKTDWTVKLQDVCKA